MGTKVVQKWSPMDRLVCHYIYNIIISIELTLYLSTILVCMAFRSHTSVSSLSSLETVVIVITVINAMLALLAVTIYVEEYGEFVAENDTLYILADVITDEVCFSKSLLAIIRVSI